MIGMSQSSFFSYLGHTDRYTLISFPPEGMAFLVKKVLLVYYWMCSKPFFPDVVETIRPSFNIAHVICYLLSLEMICSYEP